MQPDCQKFVDRFGFETAVVVEADLDFLLDAGNKRQLNEGQATLYLSLLWIEQQCQRLAWSHAPGIIRL